MSSALLQTPAALGPHTQKTNTEDASGSGARATCENTSGTMFLSTHCAQEDRPCLGGRIVKDSESTDSTGSLGDPPSELALLISSLLHPLCYAPSPTRACRRGHGQAPQTSSVSPTVCICGTSPSISRRFHTAFPATSGGDGIYYINRTDSHASAGRRWGVQAVPGAVALLAEPRGRGHRTAAPPPSPPPARGAAAATDGQDGACADPRMTRLHRCRDFPCVISRSKKG